MSDKYCGVSEQGRSGLLWSIFECVPLSGRRVASFSDHTEAGEYLAFKNGQGESATLRTQLAEAQARIEVKDEALNTVLGDFKKSGECCPNFSDGEYTQDYTTRRELINKALSPTAGQSLLEEVKGLREAVQRFLDEFGPNQCECKSPSPLMEGKTICDYCFGRAALKKGEK